MLYVTDQRRRAVIALESLDAGTGFYRLAPNASTTGPLLRPAGLAIDPDGRIIIADTGNNRVVAVDPNSGEGVALDATTSPIGPLFQPTGVAVTSTRQLVVADTGNHRIVFAQSLDLPDWSAFGAPGSGASGEFVAPISVYVDALGRTLVADPGADRLIRIDDWNGSGWTELELPAGLKKPRPYALAAGPDDTVLVTDLLNSRVLLLSTDDSFTALIDGAVDRSVIAPVGVAMLSADLYVADAAAAQVTRWNVDAETGAWTLSQHLLGIPGPLGGPQFSQITGLAAKETL